VYLRAIRDLVGPSLLVQIDPTDYVSRLASALEQVEATRAQIAGLGVTESRLLELVGFAREEREIQERELARIQEASVLGGGNESEIERRRATLLLAQRNETSLLEQIDQIGPRRTELRARLGDLMAAAEMARLNVARTVVTSPIAGAIQEVRYRPGEWAAAGSVIARVVDLSRVEVPLRVPVSAAASIAVGDAAVLRSDSRGGLEWAGVVARLAPEVDPQTRTFTVFVEVEQDAGADRAVLRPGQFVVGRITTGTSWPVLLVPRRAVDQDAVFVAADAGPDAAIGSRVVRRVGVQTLFHVAAARPDLDPVETQWSAVRADGGLAPGAPVIVSNLDDLHDGLLIATEGTGNTGGPGGGGAAAAAAPGDGGPTP
jgi:RND family efflux transporter MFP subunit